MQPFEQKTETFDGGGAHLESIQGIVLDTLRAKYRKGQQEHGGNLVEMPLATCLINNFLEHLDGLTYTTTALQHLGIDVADILFAIEHNK